MKKSATATAQIGFDGGKIIKGRKRFVLVDTLGATVATCVLSANAHDGQSVLTWWAKLARHPLLGQVQRVFIDGGFRGRIREENGQVVSNRGNRTVRSGATGGQVFVHAMRWVVERSISWIINNRRLTRCYERKVLKKIIIYFYI